MRTTKILEGAIARALFDSVRRYDNLPLKDGLMLQILSMEGTLAHTLLAEWLSEEEMCALRDEIANGEMESPLSEPPEVFYRNYTLRLTSRFGSGVRLSTIHALIEILSDRSTLSAHIFPRYGITITLLTSWLMHSFDDKEAI